jgi:RNA ligase (TIGR02306 family)
MLEKEKSTHKVEIVPIVLEEHPNADSLSIVHPFGSGYTVVVRTEDWIDTPLGAYIPPDSIVPDDEQFAFLNGHNHIKVRRFRGVFSQGLLVPAPEGAQIGDDVTDQLGISHYEPPISTRGGQAEAPPPGFRPKYDVDSGYRYGSVFQDGEEVIVTEKIHGASARYAFVDGRMRCGSRNEWKKEDPDDLWWRVVAKYPEIQEFCIANPQYTLYGEVFGNVQSLKYGAQNNQVFFRAFDIWDSENAIFVPYNEAIALFNLWVPEIFRGPFNMRTIEGLSDGFSLIEGANHIREGIVVHPVEERTDLKIGRVKLKWVSNQYLEKGK